MGFLLGLLGPLGAFIGNLLKSLGPPAIVTESEKAGVATQALKQEQDTNVEVAKAAKAGDDVAIALAKPGGLQSFEAHDPNNRDND